MFGHLIGEAPVGGTYEGGGGCSARGDRHLGFTVAMSNHTIYIRWHSQNLKPKGPRTATPLKSLEEEWYLPACSCRSWNIPSATLAQQDVSSAKEF